MIPHHRSRRPRRLVGARLVVGALVLAASLLALAAARGSTLAAVGGWTIDGTVPDAGAVQFADPYGSVNELGPVNSSATKLVPISSATPPMLDMTDPNPQTDLRNVWLGMKTSGGDAWLYLAWERDSATGSGVIMFEFDKAAAPAACDYGKDDATLIAGCNPWANRSAGDFVLLWDQHGQTIDIVKRTFVESGGSLTLGPGTVLDSAVSAAAASEDGFFGEAAVDLSKTVFGEITGCETFANIIPGTITGNSDTADFKDTVLADFGDKVFLSSCGEIRVTKATVPATAPEASFPYTVDRAGGGALRFGDGAPTSVTGTLTHNGDFDLIADLRAGTDFRLAEELGQATLDAGWTKDAIVCSLGGTDYPAGAFPVAVSLTTECTITNSYVRPTGTLVVKKVVVNDDGGTKTAADFSFSVNGGPPIAFEADGENVLTLDPGTYVVTEPSVAGYATTYDGCDGIVLAKGETKTCEIGNDDQPATLVVKKVVVNDDGGTKTAADFSFSVNGGPPIAFEADGENVLTLDAGTYSVTEPTVAGYSTTYGGCSGIVLANGERKTCEIGNDDKAATLVVKKVVVNDNGGTKTAADFSFSVNGGEPVAFAAGGESSLSLPAGTYSVTEPRVAGYATTYDGCSEIVLANGGTKTCEIRNDDQPATLVVKKVVVNDNGGTKTAADFSFGVNGGEPVAFEADGGNSLTLDAGTYSVTEPAVAGYATTYDGCTEIALANGETKTCTITNNDRAATLKVVKHVVNDDLGTAKAGDFTISVTGTHPSPASFPGSEDGTTVTVWPGAYVVGESGPSGYIGTFSPDCTGTIALGESKTCTVLNEDVTPIPPKPVVDLSITKLDTPDPVEKGAPLTYTMVVTNKVLTGGSFAASNVTVTDPAPAGVVFISATATAGTCTVDATGLTCKLGTIVAGGSVTITITASPQAVGTVTNVAVVQSTEPDVNTADNQASASTLVVGPFTPPAICSSVRIKPVTVSVGRRTVVVVLVRDQRGNALPKATVRLSGPGIAVVGSTDRTGTYKRALKPKRAGIVRVVVPGSASCVARFGMVGVFQPPVTG